MLGKVFAMSDFELCGFVGEKVLDFLRGKKKKSLRFLGFEGFKKKRVKEARELDSVVETVNN